MSAVIRKCTTKTSDEHKHGMMQPFDTPFGATGGRLLNDSLRTALVYSNDVRCAPNRLTLGNDLCANLSHDLQ